MYSLKDVAGNIQGHPHHVPSQHPLYLHKPRSSTSQAGPKRNLSLFRGKAATCLTLGIKDDHGGSVHTGSNWSIKNLQEVNEKSFAQKLQF